MSSTIDPPSVSTLFAEWERDSKIDITDTKTEIIRIPVLHSKWNKYLTLHTLAKARKETKLAKLKKSKWMYYNGKLDKTELEKLGWEPFPFTLKSDLNIYMDADNEIADLKAEITYHSECASFCTYVMKELNSRTYQLREYMTMDRFVQGQ